MTLFPMIQPETGEAADTEEESPIYREVMWDYEKNIPIYKNGNPAVIEGAEAVKVWAWKALHAPRFRHEIYSFDYGSEAESLVGEAYSDALKESEAARYVQECLEVNPYIMSVSDISAEFHGDTLKITAAVSTVYGEVTVSV